MSSLSIMLTLTLLSCLCNLVSADQLPTILGSSFGGIAGLIILVLDIIAIVDILKSSRDIVAKLLWILLIVFFPVGGLIIWCLCGRKTSAVV